MKLPNAERAEAAPAKVRDCLLSPDHPDGSSKARYVGALGFTREGEAEPGAASVFGQKYVVRGIVRGPGGRAAGVVTVWIVLRGDDVPRLVTAYPGEAPR